MPRKRDTYCSPQYFAVKPYKIAQWGRHVLFEFKAREIPADQLLGSSRCHRKQPE